MNYDAPRMGNPETNDPDRLKRQIWDQYYPMSNNELTVDDLVAAREGRFKPTFDRIAQPGLTGSERREIVNEIYLNVQSLISSLSVGADNLRDYGETEEDDLLAAEMEQALQALRALVKKLVAHYPGQRPTPYAPPRQRYANIGPHLGKNARTGPAASQYTDKYGDS